MGRSRPDPRMIRRTVRVRAPRHVVWGRAGDLAGLPAWADSVRDVAYIPGYKGTLREGVGAARLITFADGSRVEEHVLAWTDGEAFTYVATSGLPVDPYVATISLERVSDDLTEVAWQSYLGPGRLSEGEFADSVRGMERFYERSLANLRDLVEGGA